ncbi:MAG: MgtC/SapB family protein, partial [Pseudomonadota bacterium]
GHPGLHAIALGSAGLMMMITMNFSLSATANDSAVSVDPSRVIQFMLGGIGFPGGGAITSNSSDGRPHGVGRGAAIRGIGGIGIACGLGYLIEATFLVVLTFLILMLCDILQSDGKLPNGTDEEN